MQTEERGDEGAGPQTARHAAQSEEEQHGAGHVPREIHGVHGPRVQAKYADIDHERNPGQRNPQAGLGFRKRIDDAVPGEAALHERVFEDVAVVVEVDEIRADDERVGANHRGDQPEHDIAHHARFRQGRTRRRGFRDGNKGGFGHGLQRG